jgi:hypothetical protein
LTLLDSLFGQKAWFLRNEDSKQTIQGQFEAEDVTENISTNYATTGVLNKQHPILQFISGELHTVSFRATLFNRDELIGNADRDLEVLRTWAKRDEKLGRPPILSFWIGKGFVNLTLCVIEGLGGISFMKPTITGSLKGVSLPITLLRYTPYSLDTPSPGETRYHIAKRGDYYEWLTLREYGSTGLGDVIRKRHPDKPNVQIGDVIKLPSIEAIRTERVEPKSISLKNSFRRGDYPQRTLRIESFERRNTTYVSYII